MKKYTLNEAVEQPYRWYMQWIVTDYNNLIGIFVPLPVVWIRRLYIKVKVFYLRKSIASTVRRLKREDSQV